MADIVQYSKTGADAKFQTQAGLDAAMASHLDNEGGAFRAAADARYAAHLRGMLTIALGDSIDLGSDDPTYLSNGGSWFSRACVASGQRMRFLRNAGVGGNTTAQCLARFSTDVAAHEPSVVILGGGVTNDHDATPAVSASSTRANIVAMVAAARASGITPVLRNCPPCDVAGTGDFNTVALRRAGIDAHNAWIAGYAASEGIELVDLHRPLVDPATGGYQAAYTSDGIHPNVAGQVAAAASVVGHLPALFIGEPYLPRSISDGANLLVNGVFTGDSNADGVANNWIGVGGGLTSKSLIAGTGDVVGNWQQATCNGTLGYFEQSTSAGYSVGDRIAFAGRMTKDVDVAVDAKLTYVDGGADLTPIKSWPEALSGAMFYMEGVVPAGTTSIRVRVTANTAAGSFQFAQFAVINLTALGLA